MAKNYLNDQNCVFPTLEITNQITQSQRSDSSSELLPYIRSPITFKKGVVSLVIIAILALTSLERPLMSSRGTVGPRVQP